VPLPAYDRDRLREQLHLLRKAAASRAKLEREIVDEHEAEQERIRAEADEKLATTRRKYAADIAATRQEYEAVVAKTEAAAETERGKLDDQRAKLTAAIDAEFEKQQAKLREDDDWDAGQDKNVFKEKRKQPALQSAKDEKALARTAAQITDAVTGARSKLDAWGVAAAEAPAGDEPLPAGADILAAIDDGTLGGATLDVFETEPLPASSRLWDHPLVTITPHNAADSSPGAISDYVAGQILAHEAGRPLANVVDRGKGY